MDEINKPINSAPKEWTSKQEYEDAIAELLHTFQELARERPDFFCSSVLDGVLGGPYSESKSLRLFTPHIDDEVACRVAASYRYLAQLISTKMKGDSPPIPEIGFYPISAWIESRFHYRAEHEVYWKEYDSVRVTDIWRTFFHRPASNLSLETEIATILISRGIPIYQRDAETGDYFQIDEMGQLCCYLRERGRRQDDVAIKELPDWAHSCYFNADHVRWYDVFFSNEDRASAGDIERQIEGYRKYLGLSPLPRAGAKAIYESDLGASSTASVWPWGNYETEDLRHLAAAAKEWWTSYDPARPITAPKNDTVSGWLQARGVGKSKADMMATILRANGLPSGPRG